MGFGNKRKGGKVQNFKRANIVGHENISTGVEEFVSKRVVGDVVMGKDEGIHERGKRQGMGSIAKE